MRHRYAALPSVVCRFEAMAAVCGCVSRVDLGAALALTAQSDYRIDA